MCAIKGYPMSQSQPDPRSPSVKPCDPVWSEVRAQAQAVAAEEPALAGFVSTVVLNQARLEDAICFRLAQRLDRADMPGDLIRQTFLQILAEKPELGEMFRADLAAVVDRDPACHRAIEPILNFKGFHSLQTYRLANALWNAGRRDFALYLQSQCSAVFGTDIHPNAQIGRGIMLDHATGLVVGETAVVGDQTSILHAVTLGGSGKESGDRHPKIGCGVMIGAGAKILGNISVGDCARIAAGSVVLKDVPARMTVAGVPAKVVGLAGCPEPARAMNQLFGSIGSEPDETAQQ
jgi:serine O-acetyltransferase